MDRTPDQPRPFPAASEHTDVSGPHPAAFEGRPLARPAEDVEDQGLTFDLATAATRRRALGVLGAGAVTAVLAACTSGSATTSGVSDGGGASDAGGSASLTEMPGETAGPYPGDGSNGQDVLETSGVERSDLTRSIDSDTTAEGVPLQITMTLIDMAGGNGPMQGAAVYLWQCDAEGRYSMYSEGVEAETYLRGVQITDDAGHVTFTSIFPGCYTGRWPHLHFEVFPDAESIVDAGTAILTSQIALPEEAADAVYALPGYDGSAQNLAQLTLASDGIFADGVEQQLAALDGDETSGYSFALDVPIDTTTEPEGGGMGAGAPGDGASGDGGPGTGGPGTGGPGGEPPAGQPPADEDRPAAPGAGSDSGEG